MRLSRLLAGIDGYHWVILRVGHFCHCQADFGVCFPYLYGAVTTTALLLNLGFLLQRVWNWEGVTVVQYVLTPVCVHIWV